MLSRPYPYLPSQSDVIGSKVSWTTLGMLHDDLDAKAQPWLRNVTATWQKGSIARASHGVIWRF